MATRYWVGGNANWDATAGTKWATASGGVGGATVPTSADDVFLDNGAGTGNVTVTTAGRPAKTIDCTGYVGTLDCSGVGSNTVSGNVTLVVGMTLGAGYILTLNATATLTSAGKTFLTVTINPGAFIITFADNLACTNFFSSGTCNSNTITVSGGTFNVNGNTTGTVNIVLAGNTTWSHAVNQILRIASLTFNSAGTITVSGTVRWDGTGVLTYTAGTMVVTGSTLITPSAIVNATLNTSGMTWNNVTFASSTILASDLNCVNWACTVGNNTCTITGAFNINVSGNLDISGVTVGIVTGAPSFKLTGSPTITGASSTGTFRCNLEINSPGTATFATNSFRYSTGIFKYTAGTLAGTQNIFFTAVAPIVTLNSLFTYGGTITTEISTNFNGTNGFTVNNFTCISAGVVNTLKSPNTYTVTTALSLIGTLASRVQMISSTASSYANFILNQGTSTQNVVYVTATDIDSSLGKTIWDSQGLLTRTLNWNLLTAPVGVGYVTSI